MAEIIQIAPQVKPGTLFVLCGIPRNADPFGDTMWLDMALRLSYPGTQVAGAYYREDGAPAPGNVFRLHGDEWTREKAGFPPLIEEAEAGDALILEYDGGGVHVLTNVPAYMCAENCAADLYRPDMRIVHGKPAPQAVNRYGPI